MALGPAKHRTMLTRDEVAKRLGIEDNAQHCAQFSVIWDRLEENYAGSPHLHIENHPRPIKVFGHILVFGAQGQPPLKDGDFRLSEHSMERMAFAVKGQREKKVPSSDALMANLTPQHLPEGFKTIKDIKLSGRSAEENLKEYWHSFACRLAAKIPIKLRNAGVLITVETEGLGKNKLELQCVTYKGSNGRPVWLFGAGNDNEQLGRWVDAMRGYQSESIFERAELNVKAVSELNLVNLPSIGASR